MLDGLVAAGMDVARLNFSHGTHDEHAAVIQRIREGETHWGRPITILQDLQGPKVRVLTFETGRADLRTGAPFTLTADPLVGDATRAAISHPECLRGLKAGDELWMDDGLIRLEVVATAPGAVHCRVAVGGIVSDHKGLFLPCATVADSCLTPKDCADLEFGIAAGVDFVAISYVRTLADIEEVQAFLRARNASVPIVAKLETAEVMSHLPAVLGLVDAVMVARGDLGLEVPLEEVPLLQKEIIRQAGTAKVPVIVATQMLESMLNHVRPTRAEVADVAAAILDGTDAVMLSAETATGLYPVEAVRMMARIAARTEKASLGAEATRRRREVVGFPEAITEAAKLAARDLQARAIVAFTQSGFSARLMSQERPETPIIALTPSAAVQRRLGLCWGVTGRRCRRVQTTDEMLEEAEAALLADGSVRPHDTIVIISGAPMWVAGTTNLLKLHRVGERR